MFARHRVPPPLQDALPTDGAAAHGSTALESAAESAGRRLDGSLASLGALVGFTMLQDILKPLLLGWRPFLLATQMNTFLLFVKSC